MQPRGIRRSPLAARARADLRLCTLRPRRSARWINTTGILNANDASVADSSVPASAVLDTLAEESVTGWHAADDALTHRHTCKLPPREVDSSDSGPLDSIAQFVTAQSLCIRKPQSSQPAPVQANSGSTGAGFFASVLSSGYRSAVQSVEKLPPP